MDNDTIMGSVIASLVGAVGWLGKRLYESPRPSEFAAVVKERDELKAAVAAAAVEARRLYDAREVELRELRIELDKLRSSVEHAGRPGHRRPDDR